MKTKKSVIILFFLLASFIPILLLAQNHDNLKWQSKRREKLIARNNVVIRVGDSVDCVENLLGGWKTLWGNVRDYFLENERKYVYIHFDNGKITGFYFEEPISREIEFEVNLLKLKAGMSKNEVKRIMGSKSINIEPSGFHDWGGYLLLDSQSKVSKLKIEQPYFTEVYLGKNITIEVWYYYAYTENNDRKVSSAELIPIIFKNHEYFGWGWQRLEGLLNQRGSKIRKIRGVAPKEYTVRGE